MVSVWAVSLVNISEVWSPELSSEIKATDDFFVLLVFLSVTSRSGV
jgi:hypothetical protein